MSSASTGGTEGSSPASSPASAASLAMAAPKYGTLVPNRIFVGGISASTSEAELAQLFSTYGNVKATKIISDRAGVSKGYGFVTFETEEEAKRLQQESECIVLRERKLNIAPAIKKQPFNRSFDGGSGSPPAVPTSTYYYTNGMGLTYQNGMTFYNAGAPAPATAVAPPADPATLYQTTSVFGPQATAGHQTFAPVMYPCPAPSLYVPQQYPYSPMPYEPYYAGAAAGAPQYLFTTSSSQSTTNGGGNGSGGGANGTGATSPPAGPPPQAQLTSIQAQPQPHHYYASAAPPPHHHPQVPAGPPQPQVDHLYYSFAAGPPPPPPPHASIGLADQQLLLYTTDASCQQQQQQQQQQQSNDPQTQSQEDSRSTSSHSEHPQYIDVIGTHTVGSGSTLVPLVPVKYPISNRYTTSASYHPIAIHHTPNLNGSQNCLNDTHHNDTDGGNNVAQMHCRTIVYHPATVYIPHNTNHPSSQYHQSSSNNSSIGSSGGGGGGSGIGNGHGNGGGPSLLPTPTPASQPPIHSHHHHHHHLSSIQTNINHKLQNIITSNQRDYSKALVATAQSGYNHLKSHQNLSIALISSGVHHHHHHGKNHSYGGPVGGIQTGKYSASTDYHHPHNNHKFTSNLLSTARFPTNNQYKKSSNANAGSTNTTNYFTGQRTAGYGYHKSSSMGFGSSAGILSGLNYQHKNSTYHNFDYIKSANQNFDHYYDPVNNVRSKNYNQKNVSSAQYRGGQSSSNAKRNNDGNSTATTTTNSVQNIENYNNSQSNESHNTNTTESQNTVKTIVNEKSSSPPPAPYSPMTRPLPNLSPPIPQVQFYAPTQNRYQNSTSSGHQQQQQQQQQQQPAQRRYTSAPSLPAGRKTTSDKYNSSSATSQSSILRQHNKYNKSNCLMQSTSSKSVDDSLGGAGDAPPGVGRLPITPPGESRSNNNNNNNNHNHQSISSVDQDRMNNDSSCVHQMQTLSL